MDKNSIGEIDDVVGSTDTYGRQKYPRLYPIATKLLIVFSFVLALFLLSYMLIYFGVTALSWIFVNLTWLLYIAIAIVFVCFTWLSSIQQDVQRLFMQQLSQAIGFQYAATADISSFKGRFMEIGHDQRVQDVLSGTYQNMPVRIFTYSYTVGGGKDQQTYTHTGFEMQTKINLPDIVIHPKSLASLNDWKPDGAKQLELEGNFDNYFEVFVPQGFEVDALQILAPDVMADLIDNYKEFIQEFSVTRCMLFQQISYKIERLF